mgnify:CR=1 FL=1
MANTVAIDRLFDAFADQTRRAILHELRAGPLPVGDLSQRLPISRPAVSQHLRILTDAGILHVTPAGNRRIYGFAPDGIAPLRAYLDEMWDDALTGFARAAQAQSTKDTP